MTTLFVLAIVIWSAVFLWSLTGAVAAFRKTAREGDPMRLGTAMVALMVLCGSLRWLFAPDSRSLLGATFVLVCGTGCLVLRLMWAYGRGRHVR